MPLHTLANVLLSDGWTSIRNSSSGGGIGESEVCAGEYGVGRVGSRSTRGGERVVGASAPSAGAAGVEALDKLKELENAVADYKSVYQVAKIPIATSPANTRLAATSARRSFTIVTSVLDEALRVGY